MRGHSFSVKFQILELDFTVYVCCLDFKFWKDQKLLWFYVGEDPNDYQFTWQVDKWLTLVPLVYVCMVGFGKFWNLEVWWAYNGGWVFHAVHNYSRKFEPKDYNFLWQVICCLFLCIYSFPLKVNIQLLFFTMDFFRFAVLNQATKLPANLIIMGFGTLGRAVVQAYRKALESKSFIILNLNS